MILALIPSPNTNANAIKKYLQIRLTPYKGLLAANIVIRSVLFMIPPFLTKYILEQILPQNNWNLLLAITIGIVLVPIVGSAMIILEVRLNQVLLRLSGEGRAELFNGIQHQTIPWIRSRTRGDLIARVLDHTDQITGFAAGTMQFGFFLVLSVIIGSIALFFLISKLAIVIIVLWVAQSIWTVRLGKRLKNRASETARLNSQVTESVRETITAAHFMKASGLEAHALQKLSACFELEQRFTGRNMLTEHAIDLMNTAINGLIIAIMYYWGGLETIHSEVSIGDLVAFMAVYNWMRPFGVTLYEMYYNGIKLIPLAEKIAEIACPAPVAALGKTEKNAKLRLQLNQVSYTIENRTILKNIQLTIEPGQIISIIGRRGTGKSMLTRIMLGLLKPDSGQLTINDTPLEQWDNYWLRNHMLCISQDVLLRRGTIRDNILFGLDKAEPKLLEQAVKIAEMEEWINSLPDGINTEVGEQGFSLSGGERQRISIARALMRKPSVLILDEATSASDLGTEHRLIEKLLNHLAGSTLIFITHRMRIASFSDRVFHMKDGELIEIVT